MQGLHEKMKAFIVDGSHLVIAKNIKEALLLVVDECIIKEEGIQVKPVNGEFEETSFFRKIGDLNNLEEVKALLTFYKDESISLSYNGQYVLSQETVGGYIRSREDDRAVLLCSKQTKFNQIIGEDTWMKVDELNPVATEDDMVDEPTQIIEPSINYSAKSSFGPVDDEEKENEDGTQAPWPYAVRRS